MKRLITYGALMLIPFLFGFSTINTNATLADEIVGTYTGMFAKDGELNKEFQVRVTKLSDDVILIEPLDGISSQQVKAKIREDNLSAIRVIRLEPVGDVVLKNGMMTPVNGRLSYGLSSKDGLKLEVFSGIRGNRSIDK
ncbi:MAG: hypothetical protein AAFZ15_09105 [Bacteroidota bacterium]